MSVTFYHNNHNVSHIQSQQPQCQSHSVTTTTMSVTFSHNNHNAQTTQTSQTHIPASPTATFCCTVVVTGHLENVKHLSCLYVALQKEGIDPETKKNIPERRSRRKGQKGREELSVRSWLKGGKDGGGDGGKEEIEFTGNSSYIERCCGISCR